MARRTIVGTFCVFQDLSTRPATILAAKLGAEEETAVKLIHLSDLHLGKRVNDFPMLEDQAYILERILEIADE